MAQYRIPVEETFSWQRPVIDKDLATPPGSPTKGDRYIVAGSPTGAWVGHTDHIAWYDGAIWKFDTPLVGWTTHVNDELLLYKYSGSAWGVVVTGDMLKSVYDTDNDGIVDKAETVDDGAGNASTAANVKDAVTKKHVAGTDQGLDTGGPSSVTVAQVKLAYDSRGTYDSDLGAILMNL